MGDKILMQTPPNISRNKTKGRSCICSWELFQKGLWSEHQLSAVSGMEARNCWEARGKGEKLRLSYRVIYRLVWALDQPNVTFLEAASCISGCPNIIIKWCLLNILLPIFQPYVLIVIVWFKHFVGPYLSNPSFCPDPYYPHWREWGPWALFIYNE